MVATFYIRRNNISSLRKFKLKKIKAIFALHVLYFKTFQDPRFGTLPLYYPHKNPPIKFVRVTIKEKPDHTVKSAYEGKTFFWGLTPKKGEVIEFWFSEPTNISR